MAIRRRRMTDTWGDLPGKNIEITKAEIAKIRSLDDFDLTMLLSEINDHNWIVARATLKLMPPLA